MDRVGSGLSFAAIDEADAVERVGTAVSGRPLHPAARGETPPGGQCVRHACWPAASNGRARVNVAAAGPPIWHSQVMLRASRWTVDCYVGSANDRSGRDALLAVDHADRVVVAVADGVTPTDRTPSVGELDGAQHAAHTVLTHIAATPVDADVRCPLLTANAALLEQLGGPGHGLHPRDHPQTAVVAASVLVSPDARNEVVIARAGDCEAWTRCGERWTLQTPTPMLRETSRAALRRWDAAHPGATCQERIQEEMRVLTRSSWNVTPLGRFEYPDIERHTVVSDVDAIALVTDGVEMHRFNGDPPDAPRDWLPDAAAPHPCVEASGRRRDDVALVFLRLA